MGGKEKKNQQITEIVYYIKTYIDFLTLGKKSLMREDNSYTDKGIVQPLQI